MVFSISNNKGRFSLSVEIRDKPLFTSQKEKSSFCFKYKAKRVTLQAKAFIDPKCGLFPGVSESYKEYKLRIVQ